MAKLYHCNYPGCYYEGKLEGLEQDEPFGYLCPDCDRSSMLPVDSTDFDKVKSEDHNFTWGEPIRFHRIGDVIRIIEYECDTGISFHCCGFSHSTDCLHSAIALCMAKHHDGLNSMASIYFCRAIGIIV